MNKKPGLFRVKRGKTDTTQLCGEIIYKDSLFNHFVGK